MNLPTRLTILRLILTIVVIGILIIPFEYFGIKFTTFDINGVNLSIQYVFAGIIFIIASLTDWLDGYLARKNNQVTDLGKMLDAIADKFLVNSVLIILAYQGYVHVIVPVVVVLRDEIVNAIKMEAARSGKAVAAINTGKFKTAFLMTGIVLVFFSNIPFEFINIRLDQLLLFLATVLSLVSGVQYFIMNKNLIFKKEEVLE